MKVQGFAEKLADFAHERRFQPYAWGTNDCVIFAADGIQAITGRDPISELRGKWTDEATAQAVLEEQGGLIHAVDMRFARRENKAFAQRGDLCMLKLEDGTPSLGICMGMYCAAPGVDGMLLFRMDEVRLVWEV